jgi:hypothetical protein
LNGQEFQVAKVQTSSLCGFAFLHLKTNPNIAPIPILPFRIYNETFPKQQVTLLGYSLEHDRESFLSNKLVLQASPGSIIGTNTSTCSGFVGGPLLTELGAVGIHTGDFGNTFLPASLLPHFCNQ